MNAQRPSNDTVPNRKFGLQADGSFHHGTDWGWGSGRQVFSMLPGISSEVVQVKFLSDYGNVVRLLHGRDTLNRVIESRYCHLADTLVAKGEMVTTQQIGVMGSTGSLTKEVHLHSELWVNGTRVDETTFPFTMSTSEPERKNGSNMTSLYYKTVGGVNTFALAGDSPGTPANWLETTTLALANQWAAQVGGPAALLIAAQFDAYKADYLAPLSISGSSVGSGLTVAEHDRLFDIPTRSETATLHTEQTGDINTHTTEAVNGLTLSAS